MAYRGIRNHRLRYFRRPLDDSGVSPTTATTAPRGARPARIALVGERTAGVPAHTRYAPMLEALWRRERLLVDAYWVPTSRVEGPRDLAGFDGVWLVPGSPYRSEAGAVNAVRTAREGNIPLLATCGGFLHALLEFARHVCAMPEAAHAEHTPGSRLPLIVPLTHDLAGREGAVHVAPGSLAEEALGTRTTVERYQCTHGLDPRHDGTLRAHGLRFTGHDDAGRPRMAELPGHPFFLCTLFQPELADDTSRPHPLVRAFAAAAVANGSRTAA
jgi:CTP synthase (UTP-ammonia lyase)